MAGASLASAAEAGRVHTDGGGCAKVDFKGQESAEGPGDLSCVRGQAGAPAALEEREGGSEGGVLDAKQGGGQWESGPAALRWSGELS